MKQHGRTSASVTLSVVFKAWCLSARFQHHSKQHRQAGKNARRQFLHEQLERAELAASRHDTHELFSVVKALAPRTRRIKMHIRTAQGDLLSPGQEAAAIRQHFEEVFSQGDTVVGAPCMTASVAIAPEETQGSLRKLKTGKAVPPGFAPTSAWKACAAEVLEPLALLASTACQPGAHLPDEWTHCWLALLPKPGKSTRLPKDLSDRLAGMLWKGHRWGFESTP